MNLEKKSGNVDENIERVAKLPEEYVCAVEEIVDGLDRDWRNRIVYGKYISCLCDVFEKAVAEGKSVDEVVGPDRKAYAKQMEEKYRFMDTKPTQHNTMINILMIVDFVIYIGLTIFSNGAIHLAKLATTDIIFLVLGFLVVLASFIFKYFKVKGIGMKTTFIPVQFIVSLGIVIMMQYTVISVAIVLILNIASDYMLLNKYLKN